MSSEPAQWPPIDEDSRVIWPLDPDERIRFARQLFVRTLVETIESRLDYATDVVTNPRPARRYEETDCFPSLVDRHYRKTFSCRSDAQKQIVLRLTRNLTDGILMQLLFGMNQLQMGDASVKIALVGTGPDGQPIEVPVTSVETDLTKLYAYGSEQCGRHSQQLLDDLKAPPDFRTSGTEAPN